MRLKITGPKPFAQVAAIFALLLAARIVSAADTYCNPLLPLVADPFIFHEAGVYYLYGTSAGDGFMVWTSDNLVDWQLRGHAFKRNRESWSRNQFWAPELFKHNGKYYLHYTVRGDQPLKRRIVLAVADSPLGPFKELAAPWFEPQRETIDSHVFRDTDGKLYLYSVYLDRPGSPMFEIHVRKLDEDLKPQEPGTLCIKADLPWEGIVNEGPFISRVGDTYLLTYSAVGYASPDYCVGIASARSPLGPWTKKTDAPILRRVPGVSGPGHHCFIDSPDGKERFIAYHTHQSLSHPGGPRQLAIDRIAVEDGTIRIKGPTTQPQPMPSGAKALLRGQSDEFDAAALDRPRWSIFNENPSNWKLDNGALAIRADDGDVFEERADWSNLLLVRAPDGDFTATTRVMARPEKDFEQAAIFLWQDHNHFNKLALLHSQGGLKFEIAAERNGHYTAELHACPDSPDGYWLRISRTGPRCELSVSPDSQSWHTLATLPGDFSEPRVGIGASSPGSGRAMEARFDFMRFAPRP